MTVPRLDGDELEACLEFGKENGIAALFDALGLVEFANEVVHAKQASPVSRPTEMNDDTYRVLVNYIRDVADHMGLKDWQFTLDRTPAAEGRIGSTEIWGDSHTATVWIGAKFFEYGPQMQRETIVHELVHWHTDKLIKTTRVFMRRASQEMYLASNDAIEVTHELAVDGIAAAWARYFPLIDWQSQAPLYSGYEQATPDEEAPHKD